MKKHTRSQIVKNKEAIKGDINFPEACKILGKSERTLSRYIKKGLINPEKVKSDRRTIKYRFSQVDLENLKVPGKNKTKQAIRQGSEVITLLKETKVTKKGQKGQDITKKGLRIITDKADSQCPLLMEIYW